MDFRQLSVDDAQELSNLFIDMYSNLENLEWFPPMPIDKLNLENILTNSRYFIYGAFVDKTLIAVSSLDYKCSKLIGVVDFPEDCDTSKIIEIGFSIVHSNHRGQGLMKELVNQLLEKAGIEGYVLAFSRVHRFNFASIHSLLKAEFTDYCNYKQDVNKDDFNWLYNLNIILPSAKTHAEILENQFKNDETILFDYKIMIKKL